MGKNPMDTMRELDEELVRVITDARKLAFEENALSKKMKYLIALAIDASHGATEGIRALAAQAMKSGASREEILEVLRVAYFISGVGSIYAASRALDGIL
jgi:alkylhydroperoxidase/carboxymuconolactone decarboxylase family protein YurZ